MLLGPANKCRPNSLGAVSLSSGSGQKLAGPRTRSAIFAKIAALHSGLRTDRPQPGLPNDGKLSRRTPPDAYGLSGLGQMIKRMYSYGI